MDYGNMISDAFEYTREALIEKWMRWVLLAIVSIIPIVNFISFGYIMEIYRGTKPAPEPEDWATLFMDGLKFVIVSIAYQIPAFLIFLIFGGIGVIALLPAIFTEGDPSASVVGALISVMGGAIIAMIVSLILGLLFIPAGIRFTRTGSIGEAFNFSAILEKIGKIGWVEYIIALVVLWITLIVVSIVFSIVTSIVGLILGIIPIIGWIVSLLFSLILLMIITVPLQIFVARYLTLIYDSA